jgi:excisionase family DNA binding protein
MTEPLAVLTIEEAAELLRIGRSAAYEAARRGQLPVIRLGRSLRVPRHQLDRMLGVQETNEAAGGNGDLVANADAGGGRGED